ncbi:CHAT domain-containing protein [Hyalangium versicolor]|uniref:CHAT domain-containing protein n=1 Tax=Hyalangium versicolor TaxID=2861190 RepID=UPI001CCFC864|nr:CHAT domain-containing protein [Hyalangium versicolor]
MTEACQRVHALVDGQLSPEEAQKVRLHLATCAACQEELDRLLQLKALAQDHSSPEPVSPSAPADKRSRAFRPRWNRYARNGGLAVLATAMVSAALLLVLPRPDGPRAELLWMMGAPTRSIELRSSYPGADIWRPYETMRSEHSAPQAPAPLQEMAKLEEAGDMRGIAAVYLLRKDAESAAAYLARAGDSPDVETDRAGVDLLRGDVPEALRRLDGVLTRTPQHAQAMWNRALALAQLGLELAAAEQFEAVAVLNEPGWADEARRRAGELRDRSKREREGWQGALSAGAAMMAHTAVPSTDEVQRHPGVFRLYLYDALRTARTVEQVRALFSVAEALDALDGGTVLRDAVRQTEARDLNRRAPLAENYAHLARREPVPGGVPAFLDRLRAAREEDLLLGALLHAKAVAAHLEEYERLATTTRDPWFLLLSEHEHAKALVERGELLQAEQRLLSAVKLCEKSPVAYRCAQVERELATLYLQLHRPAEAAQHAQASWQWARKDKAWSLEIQALLELAQSSRFRRQHSLAHAYLQEVLAREPKDCELRNFVFANSASAHLNALEIEAARQDMNTALQCPGALTSNGALVLAELARMHPAPQDAERLTQGLSALRRSGRMEAGQLALLTHIEGRFLIEQDRAAGETLLHRAISEARQLPHWNVAARKARAYSYTSLMLAAGKAQEFDRALELVSEEFGGPLPERCVLSATVDDERTLLLARGQDGQLRGHYDASRTQPLESVEGLIPEEMLRPLRACERVVVVARPPLHGRAGLLPPEIAWSYFLPHPSPTAPTALPPRRLVVADVEPPPALSLAPLGVWGAPPPGGILLSGAAATPSHVIEAMTRATEVEIHAHGLINPDVSDASLLVLAPESDGRYALTAGEVRARHLEGAPLVILAACRAAYTGPAPHEPFSLPVAFLEAGARAVLAATVDVPDAQAARFFEAVRARIQSGQPVALALRDERVEWLKRGGSEWVRAVLAFE